MQVGDFVHGGIYVGDHSGHHIICSPVEYELPFEVDWHQATEYCKSIGMELPTKEELNLLYRLYKSFPEYFPNTECPWYWSSTESSSTNARSQFFYDGDQLTLNKNLNGHVRAVRRVKITSFWESSIPQCFLRFFFRTSSTHVTRNKPSQDVLTYSFNTV